LQLICRDTGLPIYPLSYKEFSSTFNGDEEKRWSQYITYGGMPYILSTNDARLKGIS
jgi:predicted AAA+ superfamily ATPase